MLKETLGKGIIVAAIVGASVYGGMKYESYKMREQTGLMNQNGSWVFKDGNINVPIDKIVLSYRVADKFRDTMDELLAKWATQNF